MNNLQKLLKLRRLSAKQVSDRIGHGYHITQKVIKGTTRTLADGTVVVRRNRDIEAGVAELLGITHEEAWGEKSSQILRGLIRQELKKQAEQRAQKLREQWLQDGSVPKKRKVGNV